MAFGFLLAVVCSVGFAVLDGLRKLIVRDVPPAAAAGLLCFLQAPLFFAISAAQGLPSPPLAFWGVALLTSAINVLANVMYLTAVKISPLSLTIPYLAFTPALLLVSAWVILGELPSALGVAGVVLVTLGAYLLQRQPNATWLAPLRALRSERGSVMMLLVSLLWALTASFDKLALRWVPPAFYGAIGLGLIGTTLLAYCLVRDRPALAAARPKLGLFFAGALVGAVALYAQYESFDYLFVSYTIAIKRAGMLLSVLIGWAFFQEQNLRQRFLGASVMAGGVLLIVLG